MADRPIIFSAPMVRAIIAEVEKPSNGKTQTRRLASRQDIFLRNGIPFCPTGVHCEHRFVPRFDVGDRLWLRETFLPDPPADDESWDKEGIATYVSWSGCGGAVDQIPRALRHPKHVLYKATWQTQHQWKWRPGIHMPRWASRLTLHVTGVKVERLQDISEADAKAEGADCLVMEGDGEAFYLDNERGTHRCGFAYLWENINGKREGAGWADNPWVVAVTFKSVLANIDAPEARMLEAA